MKNIVLIGLPGSGKTTLGKMLAEKLTLPFLDMDEYIEKKAGMSIPEIFEKNGEPAFRDIESMVVSELAIADGTVIATGGGTVLRSENVSALVQNGFIVFLDRPLEDICFDINIVNRPLLKDGAESVQRLSLERRHIYERCAVLTLCSRTIDGTLENLIVVAKTLQQRDFAVIGNPIGHSISPQLHDVLLNSQVLQFCYSSVHVPTSALLSFVTAAKYSGLLGFNVTIPHKQEIIPLLDEISHDAAICGAVNTVVVRDEKFLGFNTDMEGLKLALESIGWSMKNRRILILGAGGAAHAVAIMAGLEHAQSVHIAARNLVQAEHLAQKVNDTTDISVSTSDLGNASLAGACKQSDILINATPLGMSGITSDYTDFGFLQALPKYSLVYDLIYNPPETKLLKNARKLGLQTQNGLGMLIFQGILAEELFLDMKLNRHELYRAAYDYFFRKG